MPHGPEPLEIHLESPDIVLRGFTGDEFEPATLNGQVVLNLVQPTDLKEVSLVFTGTARISWRDSSTHHYEHPLFFHDFNFLNPSSHTNREDARREHHQVHTLKAGRHVFPFSLTIPGSLPASLRTYTGTGVIEYKLKALAQRPGFTAADWKSRKIVRISRSFGADAVEFNQTLEIENTWPGKVMYSFTLPHKAFAAGDTIPVAVKFSPLAKGVSIVSLITTIREHTTVYSKSSSHSEARDATTVKYSFIDNVSGTPSATPSGTSTPARLMGSTASLSSMGGLATPTTPGFNSPFHGGARTPASERNGDGYPFLQSRNGRRARFQLGADEEDEDHPNPTQASTEAGPVEEDDGQDTEVDVVVDVQVPVWTAPSHAVHPIFVNHKIKWSAFIKNPDGHVSELRCALPIHILASCLQEEARLASAGSRNLLFGPSGALAHSDVPQVDLPSYQDHIMDRVANAETATQYSASSGFAPTPWSTRNTPTGTPGVSPPASRPPSRPASPERRHSQSFSDRRSSHHSTFGGFGGFSALSSINRSGTSTPTTSSPPPELADEAHPEDHSNWIDSELLSTLNINDHVSPPSSAPVSRPGSRPSSRPSSRAGSRASSPERGTITAAGAVPSTPPTAQLDERPPLSRSHTSTSSFFNLHIPKPLRPLTSFSRNSSATNLRDALHMSSHHSSGGSESRRGGSSSQGAEGSPGAPSPSALSSALAAHAARAGPSGQVARPPLAIDTPAAATVMHPMMSNSPHGRSTGSAAAASPISASPAQPNPLLSPTTSNAGFHQHWNTVASPPPTTPGGRLGTDGSASPSLLSSSAPSPGHHHHPGQPVDVLSQVPSYDVAARGFLGGGVVPLSFNPPNYDDVCPSPTSGGGGSRTVSRDDDDPAPNSPADASTTQEGPPPEGLRATDFGGLALGATTRSS